jgi:hypothetical protein
MRLRHIRQCEEQAIRDRIAEALGIGGERILLEGDMDKITEIQVFPMADAYRRPYGSERAMLAAAGIHPTDEGWMVDDEHGQAAPRSLNAPHGWEWRKDGTRRWLARADEKAPTAEAWESGRWRVFNRAETVYAVAEDYAPDLAAATDAAERECWRRGLFGDVPKPAPATPKSTLADRIAALIEDHVRDTRAESDAYKRELDELRARVAALMEKVRAT